MSQEVEEFDPETADLEELKARANAGEGPQDETVPRNPDGTFAAREQHVQQVQQVAKPAAQEQEETVYQRRIDLGDGDGVQVFQGASMEELVDKLVIAQENATKKIKQLKREAPATVAAERTADEEFALAQELVSKPTAAFEKLFQQTVGMPIDEFKTELQAVRAFQQGRQADEAATKFVELTPDYNPVPANGKKILSYLNRFNMPQTLENITKAYTELNADGLLVPKSAENAHTIQIQKPSEPVQQVRRSSSGLSSRGGTTPIPPRTGELTTEEIEKMNLPLSELRARANKQNHGTPNVPVGWDF